MHIWSYINHFSIYNYTYIWNVWNTWLSLQINMLRIMVTCGTWSMPLLIKMQRPLNKENVCNTKSRQKEEQCRLTPMQINLTEAHGIPSYETHIHIYYLFLSLNHVTMFFASMHLTRSILYARGRFIKRQKDGRRNLGVACLLALVLPEPLEKFSPSFHC